MIPAVFLLSLNCKNYIIFDPQQDTEFIQSKYPQLKKVSSIESYSSKNAKRISKDEIKKMIIDAELI